MYMADKTIKNPLRKRILRDIRKEKGKYISIFLFLTFMISIVSGMLVTSLSMMHTYDDGIETYKLEDGHFSTNSEISVANCRRSLIRQIQAQQMQPSTNSTSIILITPLKTTAIIPSVSTKTVRH